MARFSSIQGGGKPSPYFQTVLTLTNAQVQNAPVDGPIPFAISAPVNAYISPMSFDYFLFQYQGDYANVDPAAFFGIGPAGNITLYDTFPASQLLAAGSQVARTGPALGTALTFPAALLSGPLLLTLDNNGMGPFTGGGNQSLKVFLTFRVRAFA